MRRLQMPLQEEASLNLIPIMNLFTALIPFLLLSAAFFHLSVIKVSVPAVTSALEESAALEPKITLTLRVLTTAFELSAASDTVPQARLDALATTVRRVPGGDTERQAALTELSRAARRIKEEHRASDTVVVVPRGEVPYEDVIAAVDAMRESTLEEAGQKAQLTLFPRVVLAASDSGRGAHR